MTVPWAYVRRQIARDWCVPPIEFDRIVAEHPEELRIELEIRRCEAETETPRQPREMDL